MGWPAAPKTATIWCRRLARALERSEQWQPGTRLDSWIYRIIQTIWLDRLRAGNVRETFARDEYFGPRAVDGEREPDACMTLGLVRRIIDDMPDAYRSVVLLVCVEGLSYREAASVLGVPAGTIMSRLARARRSLSERLQGRAEFTEDRTEETADADTG